MIASTVITVSATYLLMDLVLEPLARDDVYVDSSAYDDFLVRMLFQYSFLIVGCAALCSFLARPRWSLERLALCAAGAMAAIAATGVVLLSDETVSVFNTDKNPFGVLVESGIEVGVRPGGGFGGLAVWLACMIALVVVRQSRPRERGPCLSNHLARSG